MQAARKHQFLLLLQKNVVRSFRQIHTGRLSQAGLRADGWWIGDHKPMRVPKNEDERKAAAARYGLREEDYKPYPGGAYKEQSGTGDYPDLGNYTVMNKDPYENWSDQMMVRNYGEPMHKVWEYYHFDRDTKTGIEDEENMKNVLPKYLLIMGATIYGMYWLNYQSPPIGGMPLMPKQFSYDYYRAYPFRDHHQFPVVNYTFEPAEE